VRPRVALLARCSAPERVWSAAATAPAAQCSSVCFAASADGPPCLLLLHAPRSNQAL
jgi:hypothetical protein